MRLLTSFLMTLAIGTAGCKGGEAPSQDAAAKPSAAASTAAATAATKAEPAKPAAPAAPVARGAIAGSVAFTGTPPEKKALDRASDPVCAKTPAYDEAVLVGKGRTLTSVVVRVLGAPAESPPDGPVKVEQIECVYRPRVQGLVAGQKLNVSNDDPTLHNVHTYRGSLTMFNNAQPPGVREISKKVKGGDPSILKLKCDVHPWMTAYVLVHDNGHFAVTGEDGAFRIEGVPVGSYTLEAWHEVFGTKRVKIEVKADGTAKADFTYDGTEKPE